MEYHAMKKPKFKNKDGTLTNYALSCGYVEKTCFNNYPFYRDFINKSDFIDIEIKLEKPCPGNYTFHVIVCNWRLSQVRIFWECYESLPQARKIYKQKVREYKKLY